MRLGESWWGLVDVGDGTEGSTTEGGDRNLGSLRKRRNCRRKRLHIPRAWSQKDPAGLPGQKSHGGGAFTAERCQSTRQVVTRRALRSFFGNTSGWPPTGEPTVQGPRGHLESHKYAISVCHVKDAAATLTGCSGKGPGMPGLTKGEERLAVPKTIATATKPQERLNEATEEQLESNSRRLPRSRHKGWKSSPGLPGQGKMRKGWRCRRSSPDLPVERQQSAFGRLLKVPDGAQIHQTLGLPGGMQQGKLRLGAPGTLWTVTTTVLADNFVLNAMMEALKKVTSESGDFAMLEITFSNNCCCLCWMETDSCCAPRLCNILLLQILEIYGLGTFRICLEHCAWNPSSSRSSPFSNYGQVVAYWSLLTTNASNSCTFRCFEMPPCFQIL